MTAAMSSAVTSSDAGRELWGAFIGGTFVDARGAETFAVMEPATGRQIARVVSGGADLVDQAVAEARESNLEIRAAVRRLTLAQMKTSTARSLDDPMLMVRD